MRLIMVEWEDPLAFAVPWTNREDLSDASPVSCICVGILLKEREQDIIICLARNHCNYSQAMVIPKACIKRIRKLGVKR